MNPPSGPPDLTGFPETLRLLSLLWSLNAALERTSVAMDATIGVTGQQRFLLRFVGLEPGITRARLGRLIGLDAAALESNLQHLVAAHLLSEQSGATGFFLTASGASVNAITNGTVEQAASKALDEASPHERTSARRMIERILHHLGSPG